MKLIKTEIMKTKIYTLLLLFLNLNIVVAQEFTCTENSILYQVKGTETSTSDQKFVKYNPSQANFEDINSSNPIMSGSVNAIGYNVLDNYIYGIDLRTSHLMRLDANGNKTLIRHTLPGLPKDTNYVTGDCDINGNLYVTNAELNVVYKINIQNEIAIPISFNQSSMCYDFCFNPTNELFYGITSTGVLREFNMATGLSNDDYGTPTPTDGITVKNHFYQTTKKYVYGAAYADSNGSMYFFNNQSGDLFKIDIDSSNNTATSKRIEATGITLASNDGASCPNSGGVDEGSDPMPNVVIIDGGTFNLEAINMPKLETVTCCPPLNESIIKENLKIESAPSGGLNANYTIKFAPTTSLKNQMQAYLDYSNSLDTSINSLNIKWQLRKVNGNTCEGSGTLLNEHTTTWNTGNNGNISGGNFWSGYSMEVGIWYKIRTSFSFNGNRFLQDCISDDVCIRLQIQNGNKILEMNVKGNVYTVKSTTNQSINKKNIIRKIN